MFLHTDKDKQKMDIQPPEANSNENLKTIFFIKKNEIYIFKDININNCFSSGENANNLDLMNLIKSTNLKKFVEMAKGETYKINDVGFLTNQNESNIEFDKKLHKSHFTIEEDKLLSTIVNSVGDKNWCHISKIMKQHNFNRTARQCKDRYYHYLDPKINIDSKWKPEEDELLLKKVNEEGKKWKKMEKYFPGRTEVSIRNRFNLLIRKNDKKKEKKQNIMSKSFSFLDTVYEECKKSDKSPSSNLNENQNDSKKEQVFDANKQNLVIDDESFENDINDVDMLIEDESFFD